MRQSIGLRRSKRSASQSPEHRKLVRQMPQLGENVRASVLGRYMIFHRFVGGRLEILRVIPGGAEVTQL